MTQQSFGKRLPSDLWEKFSAYSTKAWVYRPDVGWIFADMTPEERAILLAETPPLVVTVRVPEGSTCYAGLPEQSVTLTQFDERIGNWQFSKRVENWQWFARCSIQTGKEAPYEQWLWREDAIARAMTGAMIHVGDA